MKAIGYRTCGPIDAPDALVAFDAPTPTPGPRDLLVSVRAVSVNPVDAKQRLRAAPPEGGRILGFDASGVVEAVGSSVTLFQPGDEVFYAGAIDRPGSNAALQCVDERIVGRKPASLSHLQAAALPLTAITAWEMLFDRMGVPYGAKTQSGTLLVINGAGGVGSILTQIARRLTGMTVIATASRPETVEWCRDMGAHHVIDHRRPLNEAMTEAGFETVTHIAALTATDQHLPAILAAIAPQGHVCVIDDPAALDIVAFKRKSVSWHWELMFARSLFGTADMHMQGRLLNEVADLVDAGVLRTTLTEDAGSLSAATLTRAHATIESGRAIGKVALGGL